MSILSFSSTFTEAGSKETTHSKRPFSSSSCGTPRRFQANIIFPESSGSTPGPLTIPDNNGRLSWGIPIRCPNHLHWPPFDPKEQRLNSELPKDVGALHRISKAEPGTFRQSLPDAHDRRWGSGRRWTGKQRALPSGPLTTTMRSDVCIPWTNHLSISHSTLPTNSHAQN